MSRYVNPLKELNYELSETYKGIADWFTGGDAAKFTVEYPVLAGTVAAGIVATPFVRNLVSGGMVAGQAINKVFPGGTGGTNENSQTQANPEAAFSGLRGAQTPTARKARSGSKKVKSRRNVKNRSSNKRTARRVVHTKSKKIKKRR